MKRIRAVFRGAHPDWRTRRGKRSMRIVMKGLRGLLRAKLFLQKEKQRRRAACPVIPGHTGEA